ncbi:glycosyltransferase [Gillisia sp. M10.2A]|uniref:Glycosyltransferase n=1 Tax=Gillisia lutea TaxID=2909668 RepID=A0ABS9EBK7_9FLAO|nr:glycosyltransferase [Gillisia lutea]MCF4100270.1 glycosyltransferase [Gillisia lutea]
MRLSLYLHMPKKRILIAPLNWGLGHATRCIPIITLLLEQGFEPVIASDGAALHFLQNEFPDLETHELPSYNIKYSKYGKLLKLKLLSKAPHIIKTISAENKAVQHIIAERNISGIISDNRWGVRSKKVPSVFITHQVNVHSGSTSYISGKIQQYYIRKFDECWVPDMPDTRNLSGSMGHPEKTALPLKYIGVLSRFKKKNLPHDIDILVMLSGPEPQRKILEKRLLKELKPLKGPIVFTRGVVEKEQKVVQQNNIAIYNFLNSHDLEEMLNRSKLVICRSGYTSLMDLAKLGKQAFLIPTPGQYEQKYLAKRLKSKNLLASCSQRDFSINRLKDIDNYKGLLNFSTSFNLGNIFALFEGE